MFRIITEGAAEVAPVAVAENGRYAADVPFVEVGGPDGVITSVITPPKVVPKVVAPPDPTPVVAPDPRVLSVAFHRLPKSGLRLLPAGIAPEVVAYHFPDHAVAAEYRQVKDEIRRQFDEAGPRVLAFAASAPVAGTTTVLLNVAVALTQDSAPPPRVLAVDANFARPGLARKLGAAETPGLGEVLGQTVPLAWAVQPTPVPTLHALPAGTPTEATADLPRLLAQLRQWFDWVLVDAGVWGETAVGPAADAVYLVTRQADIDRPEFAALRGHVAAGGGTLRGYVTTRQ
jgi:Mrp family chromosome partitioning ATPase